MPDRVVTYRLSASIGDFSAKMSQASASVKKFATDASAQTREAAKFRAGLDQIGTAGLRVGITAAAGLGLATKAAMDWETAWAGVEKTVDGTAGQMATLEGQLRDLAKSLPATHEEIAAVAEAAGQLGVAREDIVDFTRVMIDLGETTNLSSDEAATALAQLSNVMKSAPEDVDNMASTLVALGNAGASTERDILMMAQRISGAGALIGASEADVLALASAMADLGIESELGGGAMSRTLQKMYAAVQSGGKALEGFARVAGQTASDFAADFEGDPVRATDAFVQGLARVQESGGNVIKTLGDLGFEGTHDLSVLLRLTAAQDGLTRSLDLSAKAWEANNALTQEAEKRYDTAASRIQVAWNQINDAGIEAGAATLPVFAKMAEGAGDAATAFGNLPEPIKNATGGLLGLVAVTGGSLWFGSKVVGGITAAREALDSLGVQSGTTRGALTRLGKAAGVAGAALLAIQAIKLVDDDETKALSTFEKSLRGIGTGSSGAASDLEKLFTVTNSGWANIIGAGSDIQGLADAFDRMDASAFTKFGQFGSSGFGAFATEADLATNAFKKTDEALSQMVASGRVDQAAEAFAYIAEKAKEAGTSQADLNNLFPEYTAAASAAADATSEAATEALKAGNAYMSATGGIVELTEAQIAQRDAVTDTAREFFNLGDSLNDSKVSLGDWIKEMEDSAQALINFQENARRAAKRGLREGLIAELQAAGPEGARRMRQLASATDEEIERANRAWRRGQRAVGNYVEDLDGIPDEVDTKAKFDAGKARQEARDLKAYVESLNPTVKVSLRAAGAIAGLDEALATAGVKITAATGGYITGPGTATSDSIPAYLSDGEYVIKAAAVDRYGVDFFHGLNAMRFSDGGFAVRQAAPAASYSPAGPAPSSSPSNVVARLHPADIAAIVEGVRVGGEATVARTLASRDRAAYADRR